AATPSSSASMKGARCRVRRTGAASGCGRTRSSFGSTGRTGCTTVSVTRARARAGTWSAWRLDTLEPRHESWRHATHGLRGGCFDRGRAAFRKRGGRRTDHQSRPELERQEYGASPQRHADRVSARQPDDRLLVAPAQRLPRDLEADELRLRPEQDEPATVGSGGKFVFRFRAVPAAT